MGAAMNDKQAILKILLPKAVLKAMTPEAERAVPGGMSQSGLISIRTFPFRVGRESRGAFVDGEFQRKERPRFDDRVPHNELYLIDAGDELHISREHLQIESTPEGYMLIDRGSACGTAVGSVRVGGDDTGGSVRLKDGDTIGIGAETTPYLFIFISDLTGG
jgi:pSer/pThr/pTyr-binding forkhead associated (FHA) protein